MDDEPLTAQGFRRLTGVSRETLARLEAYAETLRAWQRRINLVSRASLADLWRRHMLDSAQLWPLVPAAARSFADLGSGAGFPGLVLALVADRPVDVALIESDSRKCAFLGEIIRTTAAPARAVRARLEAVPIAPVEVVCARACAPLPRLLAYAAPLLLPGGRVLALKGRGAEEELTAAGKDWTMTVVRHRSLSDPRSTVLDLSDIGRNPER